MAIDLNKPIGASAAAAASTALPTKTTMNLLVHERKTSGAWKYVLAGLVLAALVAAFAKFAVFDVFSQVDLKKAELHASQQELSAVQQQLEGYDQVLDEYRSYTGIVSEGGIDALQVMDMVANVVQPRATVTAASTSDGMLVVNVKDISLDNLGKLADILRSEETIESVTVTTASETASKAASENSQEEAGLEKTVAATLQIVLATSANEGGQ